MRMPPVWRVTLRQRIRQHAEHTNKHTVHIHQLCSRWTDSISGLWPPSSASLRLLAPILLCAFVIVAAAAAATVAVAVVPVGANWHLHALLAKGNVLKSENTSSPSCQ